MDSMVLQKVRNTLGLLALSGAALWLTGCGGSGAGAGGGTTGPVSSDVSSFEISASPAALKTGATIPATVTVVAKSASGQALANRTLPLEVSTSTGTYTTSGSKTDDKGQIVLTFSPGADKSNRIATITVKSGAVSSNIQIPIDGTTVRLAGPTAAALNTATNFIATVKDGLNQPVPGIPVVLSAGGAAVATVNSDAAGTATFTYTPSVGPTASLSAAALGTTSDPQTLSISGDQLTITPAATTIAITAAPVNLTVRWASVSAPGQTLRMSATKGLFDNGTSTKDVVLNGSGEAVVTLAPNGTVGDAVIQAQPLNGGAAGSTKVTFVSVTPSAFSVQANPKTVGPGTKAAIEVLVVDASANKNPVAGASVTFSIGNDPTGGSLDSALATTDNTGRAVVNYTPGPRGTSGTDEVRIDATVLGVSGPQSARLTVAASALFVNIGKGNQIAEPSTTEYKFDFNVRVTNSAGGAASGADITVRLKPLRYYKGFFVYGASAWVPSAGNQTCPNEDRNNDGILSAGEDINGNGTLEPRQVASVYFVDSAGNPIGGAGVGAVVSGKTDATGSAYLALRYAQSFAYWADYEVEVTTSVGGSEGRAITSFSLEGLASDYTNKDVAPAGVRSPFGIDQTAAPVLPPAPYSGSAVPGACVNSN
jgi:hypothetical protein